MTKRISILTALMMAATLTMACGGRGERATNGGGGGRELVIALDNAPTHLDSRVGNDSASGRLMDLIYAGLVKFTPEAGHAPDLAERWEINEEEKTITFHLRPNLTFQDGRPPRRATFCSPTSRSWPTISSLPRSRATPP